MGRIGIYGVVIAVVLAAGVSFGPGISCAGVSVALKGFQLQRTEKGFLVKGSVVGSGLNTPIPESDEVEVIAEIQDGPGARYPALPQYYNIAAGCKTIGGKCLTEEQAKGHKVTVIRIAAVSLRPGQVWLRYGGLGNWEKRAPATVEKPFQGYIPLEYQGKTARIHVILTHIIGGPYANWPGISYYHAVKEVVLPAVGSYSKPGIPPAGPGAGGVQPPDRYKLLELKKELGQCRQRVRWARNHIASLKKRKSKVDEKVMATHAGMGPTGYQAIIDDIQTLRYQDRAGANYSLVLQSMDPIRESNLLRERIRLEEQALSTEEYQCSQIEARIKAMEGRR